jgi:AcrR family transcriptional regulator
MSAKVAVPWRRVDYSRGNERANRISEHQCSLQFRAVANAVQQLPRGRHRLSREQVLASQRGRILAAVAESVAEHGFARVTVADVIARAGVSRETFYEQFSDKEEAFLAALDAGADGLLAILGAAIALPASDPLERLDRMLKAYLTTLAAEPSFAKAYLIDAYGAGAEATARRIDLQQRFVEVIARVLEVDMDDASDRFACEALVAAVSSLVTARIGTGRARQLPELREPLIELARRLSLDRAGA